MAEGKKSFVLYADIIHTVKKLPNNKAGELFKLILSYVNDENPTTKDLAVDLVFEPIKQQLKRDLKQWEDTREKRSEAGKLGGRPKANALSEEAKKANAFQEKQTEAKKAVSVNAIVNDNVTVKERENTETHPDLSNSNIFRKANIPTKDKVLEVFLNHGGTAEMATKFFHTYEATEWFGRNGPIKNFSFLVPNYIKTWKDIKNGHEKSFKTGSSSTPLSDHNGKLLK